MSDETLRVSLMGPPDEVEPVLARLYDLGCLGVEERDAADGLALLLAYFPADADEALLCRALASPAGPQGVPWRFTIERVAPFDWATEVRKQFTPLQVSARLWIGPTWVEPPVERDAVILRLDPGQAFGTGRHESTRLCLLLLEATFDRFASSGGLRVLDIGCGSGILSIYAALRGAGTVLALDVDPLAVEITKSNAEGNFVRSTLRVVEGRPENIRETFDLVVANLERGALLASRDAIRAAVAPGGRLILSGLLAGEQAAEVARAYTERGLALVERRTEGEWEALLLEDRR